MYICYICYIFAIYINICYIYNIYIYVCIYIAKINKLDLIKLKIFAEQRKPLTKQKDNLLNGKKYLHTIWPIKGI